MFSILIDTFNFHFPISLFINERSLFYYQNFTLLENQTTSLSLNSILLKFIVTNIFMQILHVHSKWWKNYEKNEKMLKLLLNVLSTKVLTKIDKKILPPPNPIRLKLPLWNTKTYTNVSKLWKCLIKFSLPIFWRAKLTFVTRNSK